MVRIWVEVLKLTYWHLVGSNRVFLLFSGSQRFQFFLSGSHQFFTGTRYQNLQDRRFVVPATLVLGTAATKKNLVKHYDEFDYRYLVPYVNSFMV